MAIFIEQLPNRQWGFQDASNQSLPELGTCDNKDEAETSVLIYNLLQRKGDLVL